MEMPPPAAGKPQVNIATSVAKVPTSSKDDADAVARPGDDEPPKSHCKPSESTLFSCMLDDSHRTISLCLSHAGEPGAKAYFVSGSIGAADASIPVEGDAAPGFFQRTPLVLAGGTGGYAYSFEQSGQVQILYSISGENGLERHGRMLADTDVSTAATDNSCSPGTVLESDDIEVLKEVRRWPKQPRLAKNGLPPVDP